MRSREVSRIRIKATPLFYSDRFQESLSYIMYLAQAETSQLELSLALPLPLKIKHKGRKATIRQASKSGLEIREEDDVGMFWINCWYLICKTVIKERPPIARIRCVI